MPVTKTNDYDIATNADLGNVLNNVDLNRIGADLTALELDGGTVKVSVGSLIESQGSLYKVDTAAVTPTGTAQAGAYLFFDDSVPGFVWSTTPGTYDPARGGVYDASNRRQCRWIAFGPDLFEEIVGDQNRFGVLRPSTMPGQSFATANAVIDAACYLDENLIAFYDEAAGDVGVASFDGSSFTIEDSISSSFRRNPVRLTASTFVASNAISLQAYQYNGGAISTLGNLYSGASDSVALIARLTDTRIAVLDRSVSEAIDILEFDGTNWSVVQNDLSIPASSDRFFSMFGLGENVFVYGRMATPEQDYRVYKYDGSSITQVGQTLRISTTIDTRNNSVGSSINSTDFFFLGDDGSGIKHVILFRFDGKQLTQVGAAQTFSQNNTFIGNRWSTVSIDESGITGLIGQQVTKFGAPFGVFKYAV